MSIAPTAMLILRVRGPVPGKRVNTLLILNEWGHFWIGITRDQTCHVCRSHHLVGYWASVFGAYIPSWPVPACLPPDWHDCVLLPWFVPHLRPERLSQPCLKAVSQNKSFLRLFFFYSSKEVKWPVAPFTAHHCPAGSCPCVCVKDTIPAFNCCVK